VKCSRCELDLPRGSVHVNEDSCIEALKHALVCRECGDPVPVVVHPKCITRALAKGGAGLAVGALERKVVDLVNGYLNPGPGPGPEPAPPPPPPRERPKRGPFRP
jgi:hypothetical protein